MYFAEKKGDEIQESDEKESRVWDFREKGVGMRDQDAPSRSRSEYGMIRSQYLTHVPNPIPGDPFSAKVPLIPRACRFGHVVLKRPLAR